MLMGRVADESIQSLPYGWIAILYVVLGITRLAFFILDQNSIPGFFKGIPVPGAALLVAAPFIMIGNALESNTTDLVYWSKFSFFLMIITIVLVIGFVFTPYFGHAALGYLILYVFSPLYTWRISPDIASQEHLEKLSTS
jgi:CDP-diacylglycerol--serine O-phosphatidyltransferase